jgi:hypothetical protein
VVECRLKRSESFQRLAFSVHTSTTTLLPRTPSLFQQTLLRFLSLQLAVVVVLVVVSMLV